MKTFLFFVMCLLMLAGVILMFVGYGFQYKKRKPQFFRIGFLLGIAGVIVGFIFFFIQLAQAAH